jgi:TRAP-type C4-dicarboxylate transport system permease small subunit
LGKQGSASWHLRLNSILLAVTTLVVGGIAGSVVAGVFPIPQGWLPTLIYNAILFFLAIALIKQGLNTGIRLQFWAGLSFLSLQIFSRMLEYQTDLLLKSVILFLCGLAIVVAGLWFERYLRQT